MKRKMNNDIKVEDSGRWKGKKMRKVGESVNIYFFFKWTLKKILQEN